MKARGIPRAPSAIEEQLYLLIRHHRLPVPERELRFHPTRKWRFDFAYPAHKIAFEVEGAVWTRGRHTRGSGFTKDCEKYNAATLLGWRVLRFTADMVANGVAIDVLRAILHLRVILHIKSASMAGKAAT